MNKKNVWKFVLLTLILIIFSIAIWAIYDKDSKKGILTNNDLKLLDKDYFNDKIGNSLVFFKKENALLTGEQSINTLVVNQLLLDKKASKEEIKKFVKNNFNISDYNINPGEYEFPNGLKYTVKKENNLYTAAVLETDYHGIIYEYNSSNVIDDTVIVEYDYAKLLEISKTDNVQIGKYSVYFKLINGYLTYQKINYEEYPNPKISSNLTDEYINIYLKIPSMFFKEKSYNSFSNNDIAIDVAYSLLMNEEKASKEMISDFVLSRYGIKNYELQVGSYETMESIFDFEINFDGNFYHSNLYGREGSNKINGFISKEWINRTLVVTYKYSILNDIELNQYEELGTTKFYLEFENNNDIYNLIIKRIEYFPN